MNARASSSGKTPAKPPRPAAATAATAVSPTAPATPAFDLVRLALIWLAFLATVAMLHWGSAVCIPIVLSLLLACALQPAVQTLQGWRIPRALSAAVLLLTLVAGLAGSSWFLSDGASQLVDALPVAAKKVRDQLRSQSRAGSGGTLETVQKAATQIEQAAQENATLATRRGVQRVVVERPPFNVRDYVWPGTLGLVSGLAQLAAVVFLSFFLLASGDLLRRKLLGMVGPGAQRQQSALDMADEINTQVRRYLLVQLWTSALVGVATGLAYWGLGLQQAAVWGVAAAVLNLVPYVGSLVVTGGSALVAFLQFGTPNMALAVGGASLLIHTLVGNLLTPWLTSRTSSLNPVAVFAGIMAWGWLWGVWGLLLGIPLMIAIKAVCSRVAALHPVSELMGN
ncbi:MAG: AI-2E family transporter [Giesbergeria sp.]|nr:AI-2E family transporter [Giesbergeria sp.]